MLAHIYGIPFEEWVGQVVFVAGGVVLSLRVALSRRNAKPEVARPERSIGSGSCREQNRDGRVYQS